MCTTFSTQSNRTNILAQNYDFYYGHGLLITNKRDIKKSNLEPEPYKLEWVSKYGSITFNQFARELPTSGMNENGLAIALMWHEGASFAKKDERPFLNELQWMQYQLDCFGSVDEVLENIHEVRISLEVFPLHYSISDEFGKSAIIEFRDGKLNIIQNPPVHVLTNEDYDSSLIRTKQLEHEPANNSSLDRFARVYGCLINKPINEPMEVLDKASVQPSFSSLFNWMIKGVPPTFTYWSVLFDSTNKEISFRSKSSKNVKTIKFHNFDFTNKSPVLVLDINLNKFGDVHSDFETYMRNHNARIVKKSFKPIKDKVSIEEQNELIDIPTKFENMSKFTEANKI